MTVSETPYWVRTPQGAVRERIEQIARIVDDQDEKLTVRAITYKLYGEEVHGKELERAYNRTCKDVVRARVLGAIPWSAVSEERVESGGSTGWSSRDAYLDYHLDVDRLANGFKLNREPAHERPIRVWFEKATVLEYVAEVCREYGVLYTCTRGQMPWTAKKNAADELDPDTAILYFGDNDDKGREIRDVIDRDLRYLADEIGATPPDVLWAGVDAEHEARFELPPNARLDGLDPGDLRDLVAESIRGFVDEEHLEQIVANEADERELIRQTLDDVLDGGEVGR